MATIENMDQIHVRESGNSILKSSRGKMMKRTVMLGTLVLLGVFCIAAAELQSQAPPVLEIQKVKDNLYMVVTPDYGAGNTAVFITDKGVVLVDTKTPGNGQSILDKVKTVTQKPVTMIINTHSHQDH